MIAQLSETAEARLPTDGLVAGFSLAFAAWAGVASEPVPVVGVLAVLGLAMAGSSRRIGRDARVVAWIGAGVSILLAVRIPPIWPLAQLAFGLPALMAVFTFAALRSGRAWLARGRFDGTPIAVMAGVSVFGLVAWTLLLRPDLSTQMAFVPQWPVWLLLVGLVGFSVVNALIEEIVFRGLLQGALESMLGPGALSILLPAVLFGTCHWHGFPSGPVGALLAGSWGVLLGWARRRSGGLLTPLLAHIVADATIFAILAWYGWS